MIKQTRVKGDEMNWDVCVEDYGYGLVVEVYGEGDEEDSCAVSSEALPHLISLLRRLNKRLKAGTLGELVEP